MCLEHCAWCGGGGGGRYLIPETSLVEATERRLSSSQPLLSFQWCSVARGAHPASHGGDKQEVNSSSFRVFQLGPTVRGGAGAYRGAGGVGMEGFWGLRQCDCDSLVACTAATGALLNSEGASGQLLGSCPAEFKHFVLIQFAMSCGHSCYSDGQ